MEIIENNKLIAEFMGYAVQRNKPVYTSIYDEKPSLLDVYSVKPHRNYTVRRMKFHSSWDWLMPVQKKIGEIYNKNPQRLCFEKGYLFDDMELYLFNGQIEEHYKVVVEFIKWYNENKEK